MTDGNPIHIEVSFKQDCWEILQCFAIAPDLLSKARLWHAEQTQKGTAPSAALIANWFGAAGGLLDRADGPAVVAVRSDGLRIEEYWHNGKRAQGDWHRENQLSPLPRFAGVNIVRMPPRAP